MRNQAVNITLKKIRSKLLKIETLFKDRIHEIPYELFSTRHFETGS